MSLVNQRKTRTSDVKHVRGALVRLPPHENSVATGKELLATAKQLRADGELLAADLFCGAGGLSLGLERAGFTCVMGIDNDKEAVETHRHHFPGLTANWDLYDPDVVAEIGRLLKKAKVDVIAGGPPCQPFSKAGRSMLRDLVRAGRRPEHDVRRDLWQNFLEVVRLAKPRAVLMENVPDMALDRDMLVFRTMVDELELMGYGVEARIVDTWRYEVPQFRQRLILVAMERCRRFGWPDDSPHSVNVRQAISDMPSIEGGWRPELGPEGWVQYDGPQSRFQHKARETMTPQNNHKLFDHITRPVREDDAAAFSLMDSQTRYSDLPDELKRYREDIFSDKYKRLDFDDLSRTITAHLAKDGYGFIHPEQDRTLSIREAARIQTFPDNFRFAGSPTSAFRQIGNAVPPNLAEFLGTALEEQLSLRKTKQPDPTRNVSRVLAAWVVQSAANNNLTIPWFNTPARALGNGDPITRQMRWLALLGEVLFDRATLDRKTTELVWPRIEKMMTGPEGTLANEAFLRQLAFGVNREEKTDVILEIARTVLENPATLDSYDGISSLEGVPGAIALLVSRIAPDGLSDPIVVNAPVVRVAARFEGSSVHRTNVRTAGKIAIARLVGVDDEGAECSTEANSGSLAHLALLEISRMICRPERPSCVNCPLENSCVSAEGFKALDPTLPFPKT